MNVAQLVECLWHEGSPASNAQHHINYVGGLYVPVIPALGKWREEGPEFKVTLGYTASSRPAWATRDRISKHDNK